MSVFTTGIFNAPKYSAFPWSHQNKISMNVGPITPIATEFLNTGDKFQLEDVADVVRLAPLQAPTLDTYKIDIHAFALRLRSLGHVTKDPWSYEDFFNLNKNVDGSRGLPSLPLGWLLSLNGFRNGTLLETIGFPTFKQEREDFLQYLRRSCPWIFDPIVNFAVFPAGSGLDASISMQGFYPASTPAEIVGSDYGNAFPNLDRSALASLGYSASFGSLNATYASHYQMGFSGSEQGVVGTIDTMLPFKRTLISFIVDKYPEVVDFDFVPDSFGVYPRNLSLDLEDGELLPHWMRDFNGTNLLDKVYEKYKIDAVSVMKDYEDYLLDTLLSLTTNAAQPSNVAYIAAFGYGANSYFAGLRTYVLSLFPELPAYAMPELGLSTTTDKFIPVYFLDGYYKIISDWYINTALFEPDRFFVEHSFYETYKNAQTLGVAVARSRAKALNNLFHRYWENDYFTSAFPDPQAGSAVGIPVNGTIVDLRNANAMQKLKERLMYAGSRFRDVLFAVTGKKTSAAILEMSEVLGSWSNVVNIDSVLQQSASQNGSPLAQYAGTGLAYRGGSKGFSYTAEEPTMIFFFASIRPRASYFQGLSRKFTRTNVYDYAIPQLANVGEQAIRITELYLGTDIQVSDPAEDTIFGYTRRNGDWMWTPDEIHGDFRASLDYWHNARVFGSKPSLSESFLQIRPAEDNLNRVFAVTSDSYNHFYCNFTFVGQVIRSLPKHVHYDL